MVRAEQLAAAREGTGGHSLEHLLFLSWAKGKKLLGL